MATLRERRRRETLDHLQRTAMRLFEERGYAAVTIAEIARAAEVSESTFYRLVGGKEGLFTTPPWEGKPQLSGTTVDEVYDEVRDLLDGYEWLGLRWVVEELEVRRAVLASLDEFALWGAAHLVARGYEPLDAAVAARRLLFGIYFTALEYWHRAGRPGRFLDVFDAARQAAP